MFTIVAFSVYTLTMSLGITASFRNTRFGKWHHRMYFASWLTLVAAGIFSINLWLIAPASAMVLLPATKAGSNWHTTVGLFGFVAWLLVLFFQHEG